MMMKIADHLSLIFNKYWLLIQNKLSLYSHFKLILEQSSVQWYQHHNLEWCLNQLYNKLLNKSWPTLHQKGSTLHNIKHNINQSSKCRHKHLSHNKLLRYHNYNNRLPTNNLCSQLLLYHNNRHFYQKILLQESVKTFTLNTLSLRLSNQLHLWSIINSKKFPNKYNIWISLWFNHKSQLANPHLNNTWFIHKEIILLLEELQWVKMWWDLHSH